MKAEVPHEWGKERRGWHLDKTIGVTHVISTISIIIALITWGITVETRLAEGNQAIEYVNRDQQEAKKRLESLRAEIKGEMNMLRKEIKDDNRELKDYVAAINQKLDRLIEHQAGM